MPQTNAAGITLIKSFEGCELRAYADPVGVWTVGYGHTGDCAAIGKGHVCAGMTITQEEADALLRADLRYCERGVNDLCARSLNPNQFAALVSFAYNLGLSALRDSTLMRMVNLGDFSAAAQQFSRWCYAGGQELPGLVRRRAAEAALFSQPVTHE